MTIAAAACYVVALVAELWGIALLVDEARKANAAIRRWRAANPRGNPEGSYGQGLQLNDLMEMLLGNQGSRRKAIILLVTGVVVGAAGNFLSLTW